MSGSVAHNLSGFMVSFLMKEVSMRRTELLEEILKMRFKEAYGSWQSGGLTQEEAARVLGVCERTFRRHID